VQISALIVTMRAAAMQFLPCGGRRRVAGSARHRNAARSRHATRRVLDPGAARADLKVGPYVRLPLETSTAAWRRSRRLPWRDWCRCRRWSSPMLPGAVIRTNEKGRVPKDPA